MDDAVLAQLIKENWDKMTIEQKRVVHEMLKEKEKYRKFNKLKYFNAYPFQRKFYKAGKDNRFRFLCAANRVGKSYSEAAEFAWHTTGLYPEWWEGHRFTKPILCWAIGITGDSTRNVLQKELFGTSAARDADALGSGAIPRDCIRLDTVERDGNKIVSAQIKHHNARGEFDGWTTLQFKSTQQGEHALMGATVDMIWLDEEDPYASMAIFSQCVTRTLTTKGLVTITATPENGLTELVDKFMKGEGDEETGALYFQNATWWDAHVNVGGHISDSDIKSMTSGIPAWQLDMRSKGLPLLGSGLIYDVDADWIKCDPFDIPDTWKRCAAMDLGISHPTTAVWSAYDANTDTVYVYDCYKQAGEVPAVHAMAVNARGRWIPVIMPHDADNTEKGSGRSLADLYRDNYVNVQYDTFHNKISTDGKMNNFVEPGIQEIRERMKTGRFKVFSTCNGIFEEMVRYHRKEGKIVKEYDDLMDAMRYSTCSVTHRGISQRTAGVDAGNVYEENIARWNSQY